MCLRNLVAAVCFAIAVALPTSAVLAFSLEEVEADVRADFAEIQHVSPHEFANNVSSGMVLLFDVREESEFNVSRIPGAVRVSPGIDESEFIRRYGAAARGKGVIFYCSVGVRSSKLAELVQRRLLEQGATGIQNISGGIFRWHNERRQLTDGRGVTDYVHPYNARWGRLVHRKLKIRYQPTLP